MSIGEAQRTTVGSSLVPLALIATQMLSLQLGGAVAVSLMGRVGVTGAAFARVLLASLILGILFRPRIRVPGTRALAMVVGLGVVIAVMNTAFFGAVIHVGLGTATTIEFLGPFVVSVVSAGHRVDLLWACVAVAGVMLI